MKFRFTLILSIITLIIAPVKSQPAGFEWAYECGNPPNSTDTKSSLAVSGEYIYMAGEFTDTATFGNKSLLSTGGTDIYLVKYNNLGQTLWAIKTGGIDDDFVQKISTDSDGNVIMTGYFYGTTMIGNDVYTAYGSQDVFMAKFDPQGNFLWSYRAGGEMADYISAVNCDPDNNVIISGYYYNQIAFGDTTLYSIAGSDIYLAKYSPGGNLIWLKTAGGSSSDQSRSLSCDAQGNIVFSGSFYYDITLQDTSLFTSDPVGVVYAKYSPEGNLIWARQLQGTYLNIESYAVCDHASNIYLAGNFSEDVIFGSDTFSAGEFNQDIYIAKFDPDANLLWARCGHSIASDQVAAMDIDLSNNLYVSGHYLDTIHFDDIALPYTLCCGSREIFIINYSSDGRVLGAQQISGARASNQDMAINGDHELFLSGMYTESLVFGDITLEHLDGFINYLSRLNVDVITGISQKPESKNLGIYPNPFRSKISFSGFDKGSEYKVMVFDLMGRMVYQQYLTEGNEADLSTLSKGIYLVRAGVKNESSVLISRIIKL